MLTLLLHINADSNEREVKVVVEGAWKVRGRCHKGNKYIRIVIKLLNKILGLTRRLIFSLIRAQQVYSTEILHLPCHLVRAAMMYCWRRFHIEVLHV
jgi:hypothetical protein